MWGRWKLKLVVERLRNDEILEDPVKSCRIVVFEVLYAAVGERM
jgi:hypothetical protein